MVSVYQGACFLHAWAVTIGVYIFKDKDGWVIHSLASFHPAPISSFTGAWVSTAACVTHVHDPTDFGQAESWPDVIWKPRWGRDVQVCEWEGFKCVAACSEPSSSANVRAVKQKWLRIRCGLSNYDFISACIKLLFVCELNLSLAADSSLPTIPAVGQSDLEPDCRHTWAASVRRAR